MIITKTPLRISFVGGGSDLPDYYTKRKGAVISTAIDKYVYVFLNHRFDGAIRVAYSKSETVSNVNHVEHDLIREALKITGVNKGVEISYIGDIPIGRDGTGLGSSSALAVGVLNALYSYRGKTVSAERLAKEACQIEINILRRPIGKQDQYASAYGGLNHIKFNTNHKVTVEPILLKDSLKSKLDKNLLLFHTKMPTKSSVVLSEQKKKVLKNIDTLNEMVNMTNTLRENLNKGDIHKLGELLHKNWERKKKLASKISNSKIDYYYKKGLKAGALGGKILGSGGGGFLLFYVKPENQAKIKKILKDLNEVPFSFVNEGSRIIHKN